LYFSPRPKTRKEDLYDREEELDSFNRALSYAMLIVITGLRRSGKTSFMNVAISESNFPYIKLDLRGLSFNPSRADIVIKFEEAFNQIDKKWLDGLINILKKIEGISILGNQITFNWGKNGVDLARLFDNINNWAEKKKVKFIAAFDEVQLIRGDKWIPTLFAYILDKCQNIILILTGSEIGLLFDFLGFDNPKSPLYGRHYTEIRMQNLEYQRSIDYLMTGFKQIKLKAEGEVISQVVDQLDGIIGWLTFFGIKCMERGVCSKEIIPDIISQSGKLARAEASKLTEFSYRYGVVLNHLARIDFASWKDLKSILEAHDNRRLPNSSIADILNKLVKMSIIDKAENGYKIIDPILKFGIKEEPLPEK